MDLNSGGTPYLYDPSSFQYHFAGEWWDKLDSAKEKLIVITQPAKSAVRQGLDWLQTDQGLLVAFIFTLVSLFACVHLLTRKRNGNGDMSKQATVSDIFLEAVDRAYLEGHITRSERRRLYRQLAQFFKATDLLQPEQNTARLKGMIRSRLGNGVYRKKLKIPGIQPLPWETIQEQKLKMPVRNRMTLKSKVMRTKPA